MTDTIRICDVWTLLLRLQLGRFRMFIHDPVQQALPTFPCVYQPAATADVAMCVISYVEGAGSRSRCRLNTMRNPCSHSQRGQVISKSVGAQVVFDRLTAQWRSLCVLSAWQFRHTTSHLFISSRISLIVLLPIS